MKGYNLIAVISRDRKRLLMCKRKKEPYLGLFNFVGGRIEEGETGIDAAYRELYEETGISRDDIAPLIRLMDFTYYMDGCRVEVYVGKLIKDITPCGDENELLWLSRGEYDFFSTELFAGEGNIGHILEHIRYWSLFGEEHRMKLRPAPFESIRRGKKTVELRLYDEKRRSIAVGDKIIFINTENEDERIEAKVIRLHRASSFEELFKTVPTEKCGFDATECKDDSTCAKKMREYYTEEQEKENGVVGIELEVKRG